MSDKRNRQTLPPRPVIYAEASPVVTRIIPSLAKEVGLNESILLLQIAWWITQASDNNFRDGKWWTYQSVREMQEKAFCYWSLMTINRTAQQLIAKKLVFEGNYNTAKYDKTRWFALNPEELRKLKSIRLEWDSLYQNGTGAYQDDTRSEQLDTTIPETPTETPTEIKDSAPATQDARTAATPEHFGLEEKESPATQPAGSNAKERKSSAKKKEKSDAPKPRTEAQQRADAERERKIALVGAAYGVPAANDKDGTLYMAVYRDLTAGGVPEAEFSDYVTRIRRIAKQQKWTVTITSLTAKGRVSEYVAARDAYRAQQQAQIVTPAMAGGWNLREASANLKAAMEQKGK